MMKEENLDSFLVPIGVLLFGLYHCWLLFTVKRFPRRTVIGLNSESRHQWVLSLMSDPLKNGVLAVQTIRNNIMASTLLATVAITLSSAIGVFVSSGTPTTASTLVYGNKKPMVSSIKYFSILLCFLVAFLCNVQCIRLYAHVSFLSTLPTSQGRIEAMEYVSWTLGRATMFWSLGLRAFYLSFPLFLWIFGPIPMFVCSVVMCSVLYFLDTTSSFMRYLHNRSLVDEDEKRNGPVLEVD